VFTEAVALTESIDPNKINLPRGCSMEHFMWGVYPFWRCRRCGFETHKRAEAERFALVKHAAQGVSRLSGI
jgi:hypothetical protein